MAVRITADPIGMESELASLASGHIDAGAMVCFTGMVRSHGVSPVTALEIEHYPGMTETAIERIEVEANRRWSLKGCRIVHRYGRLAPGETIVLVATLSAHRGDAFAAAEFIMDFLKTRAPFWKKEHGPDGASWVESRDTDDKAADRWHT